MLGRSVSGLGDIVPAALSRHASEPLVIVVIVANRSVIAAPPSARLLVGDQKAVVGHIHPRMDEVLIADAHRTIRGRRSELRSYSIRDEALEPARIGTGDIDVFFELLARPPRLIIVGSGHIAVPLAKIGVLLDFEVMVLDDREQYATRERFPDARHILVGPYRETLAGVPVDDGTFIILVTRGHVHDQACLEQVLESEAAYIGMIGSKRRVRTVMEHAAQRGFDTEKLRRVRAPIGLDIGSQTPAEIAVAIAAEIISVLHGKEAPALAIGDRLHV